MLLGCRRIASASPAVLFHPSLSHVTKTRTVLCTAAYSPCTLRSQRSIITTTGPTRSKLRVSNNESAYTHTRRFFFTKARAPRTPLAPRKPQRMVLGNEEWYDAYAYLQNPDDPDTEKYINAEKMYTNEVMANTGSVQKQLYREMRSRIFTTEDTVPEKYGGYWYYTRMNERGNFPTYLRKKGSMDNPNEEVTIDQDKLAKTQKYHHINLVKVNHDHTMLVYTVDNEGLEEYSATIKNLETGKVYHEEVISQVSGVEWGCEEEQNTLYYAICDDKMRPYKVYKHMLGTPVSSDALIFEEPDDRFFVDVSKTKDGKFITIHINSKKTSEVKVIDSKGNMRTLLKRTDGIECFAEHYENHFVLVTNWGGAENLRVLLAPDNDPSPEKYVELEAEDRESRREDMDVFKDYFVIYERKLGMPQIRIICMRDNTHHYVPLPESICSLHPGGNLDYNSTVLRFSYSSPVTPEITYDYDLNTRELTCQRALQFSDSRSYDPSQMECKQVLVAGHDTKNVPLTLVHRKDLQLNSNNPVLLIGYGAYGCTVQPEFQAEMITLLQRGWVIANAHIRGGGDLGKHWYKDGIKLNKKNSFLDFISCAEYLLHNNYTRPSLLAAYGKSAGGLVMGAVANMRPDLFGAMIMRVPFLDVINTMADPSLPLTLHEYDEWGDPNDPEVFKYVSEYDPYQNLDTNNPRTHLPILLTGSTLDSRVPYLIIAFHLIFSPLTSLIYWHPLKYIAKIREVHSKFKQASPSLTLLRMAGDTGHFGSGGRFGHHRETAYEYAFLFKALGLRY